MKLVRLTLLLVCIVSTQTLWGASILIYGPSMAASAPNEQTVAEAAGHDVDVVDAVDWGDLDAADFAAYDAIVFGDLRCESGWGYFTAANDNKSVWSSVITGNVVINTADPTYHYNAGRDEAGEFLQNAIGFAASGAGTGLYASLGCYAEGDDDVEYLSELGTFSFLDQSFDEVTIELPSHPVFAGLTDADMSEWGSTGHSLLTSFPGSFEVAATNASGEAVVIVRGAVALPPDVPALSPLAMALLAAALGAAALIALRLR